MSRADLTAAPEVDLDVGEQAGRCRCRCALEYTLSMGHVPAAAAPASPAPAPTPTLPASVCTQHLRTSARFVHKELEFCLGRVEGVGVAEARGKHLEMSTRLTALKFFSQFQIYQKVMAFIMQDTSSRCFLIRDM